MTSISLSKRKNWQLNAKLNGNNGENHVMKLINSKLNTDWVPISPKEIFKGIYGKLDISNIKKYNLIHRTKMEQRVEPDLCFYNTKTKEYIVIEVKNQKARGNAHERAYRWIAKLPLIKKHLNIDYNPMVIIFTGGMCYHEKYVTELTSVFTNNPEWTNRWSLEQDLPNNINKWFPNTYNEEP